MTESVGIVVNKSTWSFENFFAAQGMSLVINIAMIVIILFRVLTIIGVAKDIIARTNKL